MTHSEVTQAYQRFGSLIQARCVRILRDSSAAEDALQEVFVRLWRYGDSFREANSKLAWLYRVADRCCFDKIDKRASKFDSLRLVEEMPLLAAGPEGDFANREIALRLLALFDDRMRQVILLRYLDEMTHEEIATITGWSRPTIIKKLNEADARILLHQERIEGRIGNA